MQQNNTQNLKNKTQCFIPALGIFCLPFLLPNLYAEEALTDSKNNIHTHTSSHQSYNLEKSVITGSVLATDIAKIPGNVSIIGKDKITNMPNNKIADIVKKIAGVRIDNDVGFNPRPKIKIRGINYGTLLMLDGIILSDLEGENRILNQISLYDVERVEVARGTFSSLYGTGAIGGVINFITSMPTKFETQALIGYGHEFEKNTADSHVFKAYASIGDVFFDKRLRLKLSAGYSRAGGYPSFPSILPQGTNTSNIDGIITDKAGNQIIGDGGKRNYNIYDIRLKAEYDVSENGMLSGMISFSNHNYTFDNFKSFITDKTTNKPTNLVDNKDYFVGSGLGGMGTYSHLLGNLSYQHDFSESYLKISFSSVNLFSKWQDAKQGVGDRNGGAGTTQDIDSTSNYFDILYHLDFHESHHLSTAIQLRYYKLDQLQRNMTNWKDYNSRTNAFRGYGNQAFVASGYINVDSEWLPSLSTSLGLRYDYWKNFKGYAFGTTNNQLVSGDVQSVYASVFSPKASINYAPHFLDGFILKSSIGSGFRMPTMREAYQFTHSTTVWAINPNLKQETALGFEIGAEYSSKWINIDLYYYDTELWNMIYRQGLGNAHDPYQNVNAGRGRIHGIETSVMIPIWGDLKLEGNYTLTLATILKNNAKKATEGKQLAATPKHMANIALNYFPKYGFYGSIWAYYAPAFFNNDLNTPILSDTYGYYESQFTLNAKFGYNFKNGIDISTSFSNITNNRYYDFYRVAGASFYMQLRYKLP